MSNGKISEPAGFAQFRTAEKALWDLYELEPKESMLPLGDKHVVRVHEVGDGEPVLFVHGTGGSGVYFAPMVRELASAFRCILIDRPGWTLSSPIDYYAGDFGVIIADLQHQVLAALEIDRAHLIGASIGNLYALRLALRYPNQVGSIVLLGGFPAQGVTPPTFLRILRTPLGQIIARLPQKPPMIRKQLGALGHKKSLDQEKIPEEFINLKVAESRHTNAMKHERHLVRNVFDSGGFAPGIVLSKQEIASIDKSVLMVYGSDDPTGGTRLWEEFTTSLPNAELFAAPDSGHLPWFDDPEIVTNLTLRHLQQTRLTGS